MTTETDTEQNPDKLENADSQSQKTASAGSDDQVVSLKAALEKAQEEVAKHQDSFLRAKAEVENIRRRAEKDVEKAHKFGIESFAKEILLVLDSIEHGLEASREVTEPQVVGLREGMELTCKMLLTTLKNFGINEIDPIGEPFNPNEHEALTMQPSSEHKPNTVMNVVQKGFILNGRVLRPARVIVAKAQDIEPKSPKVDEKA